MTDKEKTEAKATDDKKINRGQAAFLMGVMRGKGYTNLKQAQVILARFAQVEKITDISYDKARGLMRELPGISKEALDGFARTQGEATTT